MSLTACRECGAAVPAHSHACPTCGASMAPASYAVYRPAAPRPPEKPERAGWSTFAGWAVVLAGGVLCALIFFRWSAEVDRRGVEKDEVAREQEYIRRVNVWMQDTSATAPPPERADTAVPGSERAKRMWVISRMLVDRSLRERELLERHGVRGHTSPAALATTRYQANARSHPEVGRYLEGRVAAIAEMEKTSAAWMEERVAALARESGLPAAEIRALFPSGFAGVGPEEARLANGMLEMHRHFVRMDPRVQYGGGNQLLYEREDDVRRTTELAARLNAHAVAATQARERRFARERVALSRMFQ